MQKSVNGVFTTLKVIQGNPLFLDKHAIRLSQNSKLKRQKYKSKIKSFIKINRVTDAAVRIDILENGKILHKLRKLPESGKIISAVTIIPSSTLPTIKQIDRQIYDRASAYAKKKKADMALFVADGFLIESTRSNIISLDKDGSMITPSLKRQGLRGIAREVLIEKGILHEQEISIDTNGPLVLINCLRIQGVGSLDGRDLKDSEELINKINKLFPSPF